MTDVQTLYEQRFHQTGLERRRRVWNMLCKQFFNRLIDSNSSVLDLACGYGEFINAVRAKQKFGVDLNPDSVRYLDDSVRFYQTSALDLGDLPAQSMDVVFASNFLEHLPDKHTCSIVFHEVGRVLKSNGRFIIMGPNIRYAYREYWDCYDHYLPLSDLSLVEGLRQSGFGIERVVPRFLPYTMNSSLPTHEILVHWYLKIPLAWRILGKQYLIVANRVP
jgi:SAM-dependent methyltransferase